MTKIKYESPNKLHLLSNDGNEIKSYSNAKTVSKKDGTHGGFRVKLCFTITAAGQMADICIIVSGLDENELPMSEADLSNSKGIRVIESQGLTPGCTMNPQNKESGYFVFIRKCEGADTARHEWYDQNVFSRFVQNLRSEYNEIYGTRSIQDQIVRSWRDGDFSQINALNMTHVKRQWDENKIGYNKQSANRSGTEQACDLWSGFKGIKKQSNTTTMKGQEDTVLMVRLKTLLNSNGIRLKQRHSASLISFAGRLPETLRQVATKTNIKKAFIRNGKIDEETGTCPDIDAMLATIPGTLSKKDHELIFNSFDELFTIQKQNGQISDAEFERLGFPKDSYSDGAEFQRKSDYAPRMRSFDLSHEYYFNHQKEIELKERQVVKALR